MNYRLNLFDLLSQSVPAVGCEQLDAALERLMTADHDETAIHAARRHFKRTRALLDLVKSVDKGDAARSSQKLLSGAGKLLSASRDAQVAVGAAETLREEFADASHERLFSDLSSWLQARHEHVLERAVSENIGNAIAEVAKAKACLSQFDFGDASAKDLLAASARTYKRGRREMKKALASEHAEDLHEWRKQVQRHWRQTLLLRTAWPKEAKARAKLAKTLSDALGLHHDLAVLREMIEQNRAVFRTPADVNTLLLFIEEKQASLLADAKERGEHLFSEKPKGFHARLKAHWKSVNRTDEKRPGRRKKQKCTKKPPCGPGCKCEKKLAAKA
ncbi:CHAD domain containing protein [Rhodomicrobium vannielii ATCC 17100]|uniref:CHAD domain containing protein n=1 Tax=Rhodomicrobium vannielii (strain ATCC 17100 / DSM 162 / LMG 4299 / NCIMB 10020 / ATH 3.1.1) TaxID=648757 RepID=E3I7X3_RHOVT|nr:CHAD domain-containing protein [Rhodomicrobium vannielii]ADP70827.1 CHAD domain containing protein [Rhodomicrobium vannielii ATCC 17100]